MIILDLSGVCKELESEQSTAVSKARSAICCSESIAEKITKHSENLRFNFLQIVILYQDNDMHHNI